MPGSEGIASRIRALGLAPAADHAVLLVFGEAALAQSGFEVVEGGSRCDLD